MWPSPRSPSLVGGGVGGVVQRRDTRYTVESVVSVVGVVVK